MPALKKIVVLFVAVLSLVPGSVFAFSDAKADFDLNRARLLSFVIRQQLVSHHYSHKPLDDELSAAAFGLYLKQLDPQKRFLLQEDVARLKQFEKKIDDEIASSRVELPLVASEILTRRIRQVQAMVPEILDAGFDFTVDETIESDPDKIAYLKTAKELRERWRKTLKLQAINRFLAMEEDEASKPQGEKKRSEAELLAAAVDKVRKNQEHLFVRVLEESEQDFFDRYFNAVARAFDPHSNYLPPTTKEDFDISMRGSLEGIGATLREDEGYIKVVRIIPGSAAYRQGQLEAEDTILAVGEGVGEAIDVVDMRLRDAVSLIRGKKGTEVRLTVRKADGRRMVIPIVRDVVQIEETFVKSTVLPGTGESTYGYIKIPSFYRDFQGGQGGGRNSTDDMRKELEALKKKGIDGLVLDLRNNGGGALTDAVSIAGLFIEQGPVVQIKNGDGKVETLTDEDKNVVYAGPLVVLVNKFSASASEILAGALQDYDRALIVGSEHTHGKGTVQAVIDLDRSLPFPNMDKYRPLGAMKVTIQKFYRVSGESTQFRGVVPDVILPDRLQYVESGEQYLEHSLPWDRVLATDYAAWPPPLNQAEVEKHSRERAAHNEEFAGIRKEAEEARKRMEQTTISLRLADARQERDELQRQRDASTFHGDMMGGNQDEEKGGSEEERRRRWVEKTAQDPYVVEATAILSDLRGSKEMTPATASHREKSPVPN